VRVLVTGASGFVGRHLCAALPAAGHETVAVGGPRDAAPYLVLDLADTAGIREILEQTRPEAIIHLAGQAFVPVSLREPLATLDVNAGGTARLLEGVRALRDAGGGPVRTLIVSSAEVYGIHRPERMPLDESTPLRPANPYAASKAAAEAIGLAWGRSYELDVVVARPFNHIGPGQDRRFAFASFAHQLAAIAAGGPALLQVGNLTAERDFLDVRDVAEAYIALLAYGKVGEVYNICSGRSVRIQEVLRQLITIARVPVEVREDPERMRPSDLPVLVGYASKLRAATGWEPRFTLAQTLRDVYADARARLAAASA
jgi:GDP-4-dehydro-6-deoxy-D-mannose reductase